MKKNKFAASIIEAIVVIAILSIGIVWVFGFFSKSRTFLDWVSAKIEAIEIAREWIEVLENIRNTNWIRFWANIDNCWNTLNYNPQCVFWTDVTKIWGWKTYILKNNNFVWTLEEKNDSWDFKELTYRNKFSVWKNKTNWLYCQPVDNINCITRRENWKLLIWNYIRKIKVENIGFASSNPNNVTKIKVTSIVEWIDQSKKWKRRLELVNFMTNYKK